jgi:hypothetical protein
MNKPQVNFETQAPMLTMPPAKVKVLKQSDKEGPHIELVNGSNFYYSDPKWDIGSIAHSLSLTCRFVGQCKKFYSVAEHSVLVSRIMEDLGLGDPMEGLMHDAVESVLNDVPRPAKQMLKDYKALDKALDATMRKQFALPEVMTDGCMKADSIALAIEAKELMPNKGADYGLSDEVLLAARKSTYMVVGWTSEDARGRFMTRMHDIRRRLRGLR